MLFKKKKLAKHCSVYISDKHKQIIVTPRHINKAGIIYEQDNCKTLPISANFSELGTLIVDNLNLFSMKDKNLRATKRTDWPSFKHSQSESVQAFEQAYIHFSIASCNEHNLNIDIEGSPYKDSELKVKSTISFYADKDEIGKRTIKVYESCLTGKL